MVCKSTSNKQYQVWFWHCAWWKSEIPWMFYVLNLSALENFSWNQWMCIWIGCMSWNLWYFWKFCTYSNKNFYLKLVRAILSCFTKRKHLRNDGKCFLFYQDRRRDIEISSSLFPPLAIAEFLGEAEWRKILKVYDVIICLNWNLKTQIV